MADPQVKLVQSTPGSWTHIDIRVDGIKRFHAAKWGTNFWVIVNEDDKTRVGSATGRPNVRAVILEHLSQGLASW